MKKIYFLQRSGKVFQRFLLILFLFSIIAGKINAQTYVNGNLSTGATTSTGTVAPAGFTWSEVQTGNGTAGFQASIAAGNTLADDFTVPAGPSWTISKFTFYAYSTNYAGTTSPFTDTRLRIFNTDPSIGAPVPIFGDLTTNRLSSSSTASMYRIFNGATTGTTTRQIWKIEANVAVVLAPGTYWVEWQHGVTGVTSNFSPLSTVVGTTTQPGNNAYRWAATIVPPDITNWNPLNDGTSLTRQDMPFKIDYTTGGCSGTPAPGNTIATLTTACPGVNIGLSLQNSSTGLGITHQWQSGPSATGPWTDITGATSATYNTTLTATTFFQCLVTCSGNTGTSTPVQVLLTPTTGCYCNAGATTLTDEKISRVSYNTINNPSTSTAGYENFTTISTTVVRQSVIPITVTISTPFAADQVIVWIDFNQNGNFTDPGERVYISPAGVGPHTGNITIPATATLGATRMRVRLHDLSGAPANATPCGNSQYGQVEDYTVNIAACVPLDITTQPANATIQCGGDATFTVASTGSGPSYKWQEKTSATALWTDITNGGVYSGATTATLTITGAPSSMNGYQYRVVFTGFCRSTDYTNAGTLTVSPLVANVNPASAVICNGAIQQLTITNITSPQPGTVNVASGPISVLVPDSPVNPPNAATLLGANNAITMAGIPAAAVITGISVKFNMTHTWCGDMVMVLKAPNGQILNLDYFLNSTGGVGATTGFVNTVISSAGTAALSSVTNLYTGIFRADRSTATGATPAGPTGFAPTTNLWTGLYTNGASANGTWTLAMYDGGAGDVGTLTSWDITIDYLAGIPATGVWNPTTPGNTIFTDAAATIPYVAGTPANTVYVLPTTTTDYTVVVTTPVCVSGTTTVPVTVSNPILTVTAPVNASTCANGNASFTTGAASGNLIAYQWQVSTDGGGTWTDIANGGVYSGATTATLTLTNVPATFNNNQYHAVLTVAACTSTATSAAATLTVNAVPAVTITASPFTQLYPGITTTLTAAINTNPTNATYQWFRNGEAVTGATSATLVVDVDNLGVYTASVVDGNGCAGSSTASITISAAANANLFIYPSPNNGQFQVRYQSLDGNVLVRRLVIYDSKGSRVYSKIYSINAPYGMMSVDMRSRGKGIYRVELSDANGNRIATGSVLVL